MSKWYEYRVTVQGIGSFPVDMLRYDGLAPERSADASAIESSLRDGSVNYGPVQLIRWAPRGWHPNEDRWRSFVAKVTECKMTGRAQ
jgi:hypothetical protein